LGGCSVVFFLANFYHMKIKNKIQCTSYKGFWWKKICQSCHILRNCFSEVTIFRKQVPAGRQNISGFFKFFYFPF
jgi:hypothetical protein